MDNYEQLERLARLRDSGALNEGEFEEQKRKLLYGQIQEHRVFVHQVETPKVPETGTYWIPIPAFLLSLLGFMTLFDDSPWDLETKLLVIGMGITGLGLGALGLNIQNKGKRLNIAAIVLGALTALIVLGQLTEGK